MHGIFTLNLEYIQTVYTFWGDANDIGTQHFIFRIKYKLTTLN